MSTIPDKLKPVLARVAVFRLLDTCILLQDDMAGYYKTAALEKVHGVEHIFRWFRKRGVQICLVSDLSMPDTQIVLDRLAWSPQEDSDKEELVDYVLINSNKASNPLIRLMELIDGLSPHQMICIADSQEMINWAKQASVHYCIGVTYGSTPYKTLAQLSCSKVVDSLLELPDYLLQEMIRFDDYKQALTDKPLRLRLPFLGLSF